jgi:GNAT superfamily N-acetyltransferase
MAVDSSAAGPVPAALPHSVGRDPLRIVEFEPRHVAEAARLHVASYRQVLGTIPVLPAELIDPEPVERLLRRAVAGGPAVAAVRGGQTVGYLTGLAVPGLRSSGVGVFVPEWAHGARAEDRAESYDALYSAVSARWAEAGHIHHCISVMAGDVALERTLAWLGFGLCVADAVLDLRTASESHAVPAAASPSPFSNPTAAGVSISRASLSDLDDLRPLAVAHAAYYATAPTFLVRDSGEDPCDEMERWIRTPGDAVWIARVGLEIASFIYIRFPHDDVCRALRTTGTISIGGAFTIQEARGMGVAGALLARIVDWARSAGFERLAVDFETANLPARRFWLRHFRPVCLTFERHLDDRLSPSMAEAAR